MTCREQFAGAADLARRSRKKSAPRGRAQFVIARKFCRDVFPDADRRRLIQRGVFQGGEFFEVGGGGLIGQRDQAALVRDRLGVFAQLFRLPGELAQGACRVRRRIVSAPQERVGLALLAGVAAKFGQRREQEIIVGPRGEAFFVLLAQAGFEIVPATKGRQLAKQVGLGGGIRLFVHGHAQQRGGARELPETLVSREQRAADFFPLRGRRARQRFGALPGAEGVVPAIRALLRKRQINQSFAGTGGGLLQPGENFHGGVTLAAVHLQIGELAQINVLMGGITRGQLLPLRLGLDRTAQLGGSVRGEFARGIVARVRLDGSGGGKQGRLGEMRPGLPARQPQKMLAVGSASGDLLQLGKFSA